MCKSSIARLVHVQKELRLNVVINILKDLSQVTLLCSKKFISELIKVCAAALLGLLDIWGKEILKKVGL